MAAALAFVMYRGRPLDVRELHSLMHEEFGRLARAGGTFALRHTTGLSTEQLFAGRSVDPGKVHFLELSLIGNPALATAPTPAEAGLPEGEGLGEPLWSDVLALHVSRSAGAAVTALLDEGQQVGYYALFLRGDRIRSTWLAAGRRRVEIVESKVEAARPAPEAQGGEPIASVPITGVELLVGEGVRGTGKPSAAFSQQLFDAAFRSDHPTSQWVVARDGRFLDEPEALPAEQVKSLRPVY